MRPFTSVFQSASDSPRLLDFATGETFFGRVDETFLGVDAVADLGCGVVCVDLGTAGGVTAIGAGGIGFDFGPLDAVVVVGAVAVAVALAVAGVVVFAGVAVIVGLFEPVTTKGDT